jgi:DHA1 family tetracycline resistance protein-like MFS transporter
MNSHSASDAGKTSRNALLIVFLTVFIDMLGVGILIPVSPFLVQQYRNDALTVGLLSVSYSVFQFLAGPALGVLSDRFGRRPVLLLSLLGTAIGYFIFGFAASLPVLFLSRILDGITGGNISTAQATIADVSKPEDRSRNFGMIGAAFGLGFIIGPALGGLLSQISLQAPAFFAGTLSLLNVIAGYFILPETLPAERRTRGPITLSAINPFASLSRAMSLPTIAPLLVATFAFNFAFAGLQSNFSLFTFARFEWGPGQNAWLFAFLGVIGVIMQGFLVRRMIPKFGDRRLAIAGLVLQSVMYGLLAFAPAGWMLYPITGLVSVGSAITTPTLTGMVSNGVSAREQGMILGVTGSVNSLTRVFGPLWAGAAFDYINPGAPYWTGALWIALALVITLSMRTAARAQTNPQGVAPAQ